MPSNVLRRLLAFLIPFLLAACASAPIEVLTPIARGTVPPAASKLTMLVATSRKPTGDPGTLFSGERSAMLSLSSIEISIPPDTARKSGTVQWPRRLPADPRKDFAVTSVQPKSIPEARAWLHEQNVHGGRVMVFVHGYNNRFADAVFRFAQIVHDSGANVAPILFTWPSRGSVFDYNYDRESTNFSRTALERTLQALASDPTVTDVTVLAHSMGAWLTVEALRQMAIREGNIPPKIQNVILASPDLDIDVFARQWTEMGTKRPKFTIFVSQDDRALAISSFISGGVKRVGSINPAEEPYRSALEDAGITVIDLTKLSASDRLRHGKFAESPEIVQLIGQRLVNGQTLTSTKVGLGDSVGAVLLGTASTVGNIAATTVTAPIGVLEPRPTATRKAGLDEILESGEEAKVP
jgi:esterase/lipase superfamily enzyme